MRSLFIVFCVALSFVDLFAAPLPRVDDSIDVAERNYFELFPLREDFKFALIMENERGDSNFILVNHGFPLQQSLYFLDSEPLAQLSNYLTDFEALALGDKSTDVSGIAGIISGFREHHSRGTKLRVQKLDGTTESGRLFCIHSTAIVLAKQDSAPNWQDASSFKVIQADEVAVIYKRGISAAGATGVGLLGGAALGAGLGAVIDDEGSWFGKGPQILLLGSLYGLLGGAAGFIYSRYHSARKFSVNGSDEDFARARLWLEDRASSRYLPPELRTVVNGF